MLWCGITTPTAHFYPRSPCGERLGAYDPTAWGVEFLSTLSLRRATQESAERRLPHQNFYPRSPCGERPSGRQTPRQRSNFYPRSPCGERHWPRVMVSPTLYFYPRSPCGERPSQPTAVICQCDFYPRSPCGERRQLHRYCHAAGGDFYPRSPCGERRAGCSYVAGRHQISIHALLAESDPRCRRWKRRWCYFYPRSPCGERPVVRDCWKQGFVFLSTLSLRRATVFVNLGNIATTNFYPRSPCGERPSHLLHCLRNLLISIHALLAESDPVICFIVSVICLFLSTLSLRRATCQTAWPGCLPGYFYPRSPCGERPPRHRRCTTFQTYFYPRSPCGERRTASCAYTNSWRFLSTLSLRRATERQQLQQQLAEISIHALLAESDASAPQYHATYGISIHALLAESDSKSAQNSGALFAHMKQIL